MRAKHEDLAEWSLQQLMRLRESWSTITPETDIEKSSHEKSMAELEEAIDKAMDREVRMRRTLE